MRWINAVRAFVLLAVLAGSGYAQPAPPLSLLDVPFISQSEALCGGATAAMVLRYWGERGVTAESFTHLVDRSAAGIRTESLVSELRGRGWTVIPVNGSDASIEVELQRGRPVLSLIEDRPATFHYIVIVGLTQDTVIFHDPARAPFRVLARGEFARRWQAARRWMAVIVPANPADVAPTVSAVPRQTTGGTCEELIAAGVEKAEAKDLAGAERSLTTALSCGGATVYRELAGVRVLQQRWADVEALSTTATTLEPGAAYGWRLLGTSRFVQNNLTGALRAWNRIGEPRLDLIRVAGLERTRQRVVERLIDAQPGQRVDPGLLLRSQRRLRELPAASSSSIDLVPVPGGLAELRAAVVERPLVPNDIWSYAGLAAIAAAQHQVGLTVGSMTGGGERVRVDWRFWPGRPRVEAAVDAPAPWGGVWSAAVFAEEERFTVPLPTTRRAGGAAQWSTWVSSASSLTLDLGVERWHHPGALARAGVGLRLLSPGSRVDVWGSAEAWRGAAAFSRVQTTVSAASSTVRHGRVYVARAGAAQGSSSLPPLLWFGGDTGQTQQVLLRAHPLVTEGRLRAEQLGRNILHASIEAQQWWITGVVRTGAAMFIDAVRTGNRLEPGARRDVDVGVGVRLALPGMRGILRGDVARGLRDPVTRWTFVYQPGG